MAADGPVFLTTFIEGVLVHGQAAPLLLLVPCPHAPHRGLLMPPQMPWSPGYLPPALLQAAIDQGWGIPFRFVEKSTLPVVFDERTSRLPTPWLLRFEGLEGQHRLYLTHLLRTKASEENVPAPPPGGLWVDDYTLPGLELLPGIKRLCQAALQTAKEA